MCIQKTARLEEATGLHSVGQAEKSSVYGQGRYLLLDRTMLQGSTCRHGSHQSVWVVVVYVSSWAREPDLENRRREKLAKTCLGKGNPS